MRCFASFSKSLKSSVYFTLSAHLNLDPPHMAIDSCVAVAGLVIIKW